MGRRVVVTRPEDGAGELADQLRAEGAVVITTSLIRVLPAEDPGPLRRAAAQLAAYDWIVFTSANAVRALREAMSCVTARVPRVAVVGPGTAALVETELGWRVDVIPATYAGDAIVAAMLEVAPLAGQRVLWPRAAGARDVLRRDLIAADAQLDDPVAYRTVADAGMAETLAQRVEAGEVDAITFTSPSAVRCFAAAARPAAVCVAVIGPSTADAARAAGLAVAVQPKEHTLPALVAALADYFAAVQPQDRANDKRKV